jgi:type IV secretion system protein VirB9
MKTRFLIWLALSASVWNAPAFAQAEAAAPTSDERIKTIEYSENDVYTLTTKYGYQSNIVFGNGESIETISVGDRSVWQIIPSGHRLFIRPMQQGVTTNMTVLTNKHSYQFDLKSLSAEDKEEKAIYVAKFVYPKPVVPLPPMPPMPAPPPPPPTVKAEPPAAPAPAPAVYTNYNYTYSGPDTLAPLQVFDNGKTTFIKYVELPEPLPEIYTVDENGARALVAAETQNNLLAIHTIASKMELEHAGGTIVVYNEMLTPGQ